MRQFLCGLTVVLAMLLICRLAVSAQTTGAIGGTVVDQNGAVVPNATITVKGTSGQEFTATSSENGTYRIPAVPNGIYTVTVTTSGFKTYIATQVKVDVGQPTTVAAALEIGNVETQHMICRSAEVANFLAARTALSIV